MTANSKRNEPDQEGHMRCVLESSVRGVAAVAVILALSASVVAAPREKADRERGRGTSIVKVVKRVIEALGDGLIVPLPRKP